MLSRDSKLLKVLSIIITAMIVLNFLALIRITFRQKIESYTATPYRYTKQELSFYDNGEKIYGVLYKPSGITGTIPTVIMSHGLYGSADLWDRTACSFAESGIACYCFDFRNGNHLGRSTGTDLTKMSLLTERKDLRIVIQDVLKQDFIDIDNVFLMGESFGGAVSAITAPEYLGQIKGMVLYYPGFNCVYNARSFFPTYEDIPDTYLLMGRRVGRIFFEDIYNFDIYGVAAHYTGPVLIIHGTSDTTVNIEFSREAAKRYLNATLIEFDKEIHGFTITGKETAARDSYDFITDLIVP